MYLHVFCVKSPGKRVTFPGYVEGIMCDVTVRLSASNIDMITVGYFTKFSISLDIY